MTRVRIGTCSDAVDAGFIRSMFAARDIAVVIGGEHHASLLGPINGAFISLDIWVAAEDAEEAAALLHDLRTQPTPADEDDGAPLPDAEPADPDGDDATWGAPETFTPAADDMPLSAMRQRQFERRRNVIGVLFGLFVPFIAAAHLFTGAVLRGLLLSGVKLLGFMYLVDPRTLRVSDEYVIRRHHVGLALLIAGTLLDVVPTLLRIRAQRTLPVARINAA